MTQPQHISIVFSNNLFNYNCSDAKPEYPRMLLQSWILYAVEKTLLAVSRSAQLLFIYYNQYVFYFYFINTYISELWMDL